MLVKDRELQGRDSVNLAILEKLLEVGQSLIVVRDLKSLLQKIAEAAGSVLGADVIVLYEYREEMDDVKMPPVTWGGIRYPEVLRERSQVRPHKESAVFKMLERREPFYAPNAREDWVQLIEERPQEERESETFVHREGIISSAAVPLMVGEEAVGVLFVNYRASHVFRDEEQKTIELFATQAAIATRNAQLFEQLSLANKTLREEHGRRLAAESWATLGKAAGNLLHRINNTTGIIPVAAQSLRELLEDGPVDGERQMGVTADLDRIERNAKYTLQLARALWKPFEVLPTQRRDVNDLLKEAISIASIPANVHLVRQFDGDLPMIVTSRLLTDVFVELITNAVKAMPGGGRLTIVSKKVKDDYVEVKFSDTGWGIFPEDQEKIFDLFFTTDEGSLGFGLWWVKTFLTSQGGIISVKSENSKGTTFTVQLPIEGPVPQEVERE